MGRWSQRRRGGGGGGPQQNRIIEATVAGTQVITVTYLFPQNAGDFNASSDFIVHPSDEQASSLVQDTDNTINVFFDVDITTDATIEFNSAVPPTNTLNPQTIAIT